MTATTEDSALPPIVIHGATSGRVRTLPGFHKKTHREPDAVNPATLAFLARLCADELADEGERLFQEIRAALGYRRRDISLAVDSPSALLTTRDFTFEITYTLAETDPATYLVSRNLSGLRRAAVVQHDAFNTIFAGLFTSLIFPLGRRLAVEDLIDCIEDLGPDAAMRVDYPSDCRDCTIRIRGIPASVVCDGATLELRFEQAGSPRDLLEAFDRARRAFAATGTGILTALAAPGGQPRP
ncbi:MAG: hypothetical protein D6781_06140 [Verrucomicrobia bacterium]|nr:MAG: hypothetical protein D6781_06140 [Verrucomicrobiota bacterium]